MTGNATVLRGIVRGKMIELDKEPEFSDGQEVVVTIQAKLSPGEGIRKSAGAWADAGEEIESWMAEMQDSRQQDREEPGECS